MKISTKQYAEVLYDLTLGKSEAEVNIVVEKFIKELVNGNQIKSASKIIEKFEKIYNKNNGIIEASVTSAEKLDKSQMEKIEKYLLDKYKAKQVVLNNEVKPEIKGGIILRVEDEILDGSILNQLRSLKSKLI
ncbi:MAG TPA: ATP synthase F1 subunit delta [Candidatus Moranbacteria bacterium]|nr:MAG: ATP synthase subunit delta [Candidatus Moranbacteria bacterium GW2011_GWF1_34_10]HBI17590.1 ATP synthase F1 subunit delta [Candidatus Moranbacteria bacterium]